MAPSRYRHYRAPTRPLVTAWAQHLDAVMRDRDLSQTLVFDLVREELGLAPTSRTTIRDLFSDKQPDERQAEVLARHFGEPAADLVQVVKEEPGPSPDVTGLVNAMTSALLAQTQALTDLRVDLIAAHEDAAREREAMTRMLARLEARLAESLPLADRGATVVARSEAAG